MDDERLAACEHVLGYTFADRGLLKLALTHSSAKTETQACNEREEFLGDAILGMAISEHLYRAFPQHAEGELTRIKSVVVSRRTLARISQQLGLREFLRVGRGISGRSQIPRSLMANVFEAIVAAIYLDGGMEPAREFVMRNLTAEIEAVQHDQHERNYKSILQQISQQHLGATPVYRVLKEEGPDHVKMFHVVTIIHDRDYGSGWGNSKKQAEQHAAEATVAMLKEQFAAAEEDGNGGEQEDEDPQANGANLSPASRRDDRE